MTDAEIIAILKRNKELAQDISWIKKWDEKANNKQALLTLGCTMFKLRRFRARYGLQNQFRNGNGIVQADVKKILKMVEMGISVQTISKILGVSSAGVRNVVYRSGGRMLSREEVDAKLLNPVGGTPA